ncbi:Conserved hypothetical protein [Vibrio atlanticus]|uniref:ABC-three component systems C-terminal domain-containing protein n=2 Tax=Vibrio atlanticus TaxID=693153 RepID=B7VN12_VIBA3|nr:Conserved hypothetical protein [Vibrio atlanticus]
MCSSNTDATPSLLGYVYQIRYALLMAIKKGREVDDPDNCTVTIETIDDISFEVNGDATDLIQTKHHMKEANLTDKSSDIWRTIGNWSDKFNKNSHLIADEFVLALVTTSKKSDESLAQMLSDDLDKRNENKAYKALLKIAKNPGSKENEKDYYKFLELSDINQRRLVSSLYIITEAPHIQVVPELLRKELRTNISKPYMEPFIERLEGKWFNWSIEVMSSNGTNSISIGDLITTIEQLAHEFSPNNLPADYEDLIVDPFYESQKSKHYVKQIELIEPSRRLINGAIRNCVRATAQRSKWSRENLLKPSELKIYDKNLFEFWDEAMGIAESKSELKKFPVKLGVHVYEKCQSDGLKAIRKLFNADYVAKGTYHILANQNKVGWHPDYEMLLAYKSSPILEEENE